jgi:uncharacterized protein
MIDALAQFSGKNYLSLETFKKNGQGVKTPVWFAEGQSSVLYVYTEADSGKVKRIRSNSKIRVAPCTARGKVTGNWVDGSARLLSPELPEYKTADRLLNKKYFLKRIFNLAASFGVHKRIGIALTINQQ